MPSWRVKPNKLGSDLQALMSFVQAIEMCDCVEDVDEVILI
jgi:hypothetical protein